MLHPNVDQSIPLTEKQVRALREYYAAWVAPQEGKAYSHQVGDVLTHEELLAVFDRLLNRPPGSPRVIPNWEVSAALSYVQSKRDEV